MREKKKVNKIIKEQLLKVEHIILPKWDENTTHLFIPKGSYKAPIILSVGKYIQIEISDMVLNPPQGFTLAQNWNGNTVPPAKIFNCVVQQVMGKMIKVDGVGFNASLNVPTNDRWSGWLPQSEIKILGEI